jgi:hypothetical protein
MQLQSGRACWLLLHRQLARKMQRKMPRQEHHGRIEDILSRREKVTDSDPQSLANETIDYPSIQHHVKLLVHPNFNLCPTTTQQIEYYSYVRLLVLTF